MPSTTFENANLISGQSKLYPTKKFTEYFYSLDLIEIPDLVARKFDPTAGDCLIYPPVTLQFYSIILNSGASF